jgi:phosphatidylglycerophosphatase C
MRGARREEVEAFARRFWDRFLEGNENAEVVRRLRGHREKGHRVYIVTASFAFYTAPLADRWPVDGVIATRAAWDDDVLTGRLDGANCRGPEKLRRIRRELGVTLDGVESYAYSDSDADRPLCERARYAFRVESSTIRPW